MRETEGSTSHSSGFGMASQEIVALRANMKGGTQGSGARSQQKRGKQEVDALEGKCER